MNAISKSPNTSDARRLAGWVLLLLVLPAHAAVYPTTTPRPGRFVVEHIYNYTTAAYTPQVTVTSVPRDEADYSQPESAVIAQFSAMRAGDYAWWISGWTDESREEMAARDLALGRDATFWVNAWREGLAGAEIRLVERIETGRYVWIRYEMYKNGELTLDGMQVLKQVGLEWRATQELATDYMYHQYQEDRQGTGRVTIEVR